MEKREELEILNRHLRDIEFFDEKKNEYLIFKQKDYKRRYEAGEIQEADYESRELLMAAEFAQLDEWVSREKYYINERIRGLETQHE